MAKSQLELVIDMDAASKQLSDSLRAAASNFGQEYAGMAAKLNQAAAKQILAARQRSDLAAERQLRETYKVLNARMQATMGVINDPTKSVTDQMAAHAELQKIMLATNKIAADDFAEQMGKGFKSVFGNMETLKAFGSNITDTVEKSFSRVDLDSFKNIGMDLASQLKKGLGAKAEAAKAAQSVAAGAGDAAGAAALGRTALVLGGAAAAIAGLAAGLAAFVGYVVAADEYLAKMNQTLLEGASYGDIMSKQALDAGLTLDSTLSSARKAANQVAVAYGMSADETTRVVAELNQAGIKYSEITDGARTATVQQANFQDEIMRTVEVSKAMGLSVQEVAQYRNLLNTELNIPLEQTFDAFKMIDAAATQSGMTTRTFFTAVSQATSGMALYNVRVEEAVGLIGQMSKSVGETDAAAAFKGLTGERADGAQEVMKKMVLASGGDPRSLIPAFAAATGRAISTFAEKMVGREGEAKAAMGDALGAMFFDPNRKKELAAQLSKMSGQQIADIASLLPGDMAREFTKVAGLAGGMRGTVEAEGAAFSQMSDAERVAMTLQTLKLLEGKGVTVEEALFRDSKMRAFFESLGLGEGAVMKASTDLRANMRAIEDVQKGRANEAQIKNLIEAGFQIEGNKVRSATGAEVRTEDDYLVGLGSKARMDALNDTQTNPGKQMAEKVSTISTILETWSKNALFENALGTSRGYIWKWAQKALGEDLPNVDVDAANKMAAKARQDMADKAEALRKQEVSEDEIARREGAARGLASLAYTGTGLSKTELAQQIPELQGDPTFGSLSEKSDRMAHAYLANKATKEQRDAADKEIAKYLTEQTGVPMEYRDKKFFPVTSAATPAQDFIYRPGQGIQKFSPNDTVLGMKPGGPIATGTGMGGVTININGGDPGVVYQTVKRAISASKGG